MPQQRRTYIRCASAIHASEIVSATTLFDTHPGPTAEFDVSSEAESVATGLRDPDVPPRFLAMAASFAASMARFASSGFKTVDRESFRVRVEQCLSCEHRQGSRCKVCGCFGLVSHPILNTNHAANRLVPRNQYQHGRKAARLVPQEKSGIRILDNR